MKKLLWLSILLLLPFLSEAGNQISGYISIRHMHGLTYQVTFTDYENYCDTTAPDIDTIRIGYGDGTSDVLLVSNGNGDTLCNCQKVKTYTNSPDSVTGGHTFPGNGSYHIWVNMGPRVANIINMTNSANQRMNIFTTLNIGLAGDSISTPIITNPPICSYGCTANCYTFNLGTTLPAGDSTSYSLGNCIGDTGYYIPSNATINKTTGELTWCNPTSIGLYNFAIYMVAYSRVNISGTFYEFPTDTEEVELQVTVQPTCPTGIDEITNTNMSDVYPNPSTGIFTLQMTAEKQKMSVEVYNMLGEKVYNSQCLMLGSSFPINISNQPAGIYLYRIVSETGEQISTGKLVIQR